MNRLSKGSLRRDACGLTESYDAVATVKGNAEFRKTRGY
jgi:hypothetical protein